VSTGERRAREERGGGGLDIYLVRHAVAHKRDAARWPDDRLRPLTGKGEEAFRLTARTLGRMETRVGAVFSSPLTRAWQSASLLESEGGWPAPEKCMELSPEMQPSELLSSLAEREGLGEMGAVALVGHRPSLHEFASYMISGDPHGVEFKIKKGGLVALRFPEGLRPGTGVLRGLFTPELLQQTP
jgi:phosphohistidine phosphatase